MSDFDEDENEQLRIALTGLNYPFNTDKNLAIKKQMLEIDVLKKLSNKLNGDGDLEDDDEFDEDEEEGDDEDDAT